MKIEIEIDYITILQDGTDHCIIHTLNLPNPLHPYTNSLTLQFNCAYGTGQEYCEKHFPDVKQVLKND